MPCRRSVLFLLCTILTVIAPAPAPADEPDGPQWIWFNEGDPAKEAPAGTRYFRKAFTVGRFADADPDWPAEDAVDLPDYPFCLVQVLNVAGSMVKGDEQDHPERVRP